jgi:hypothetical protein
VTDSPQPPDAPKQTVPTSGFAQLSGEGTLMASAPVNVDEARRQSQRVAALSWLDEWWKDRTCPICTHNTWTVTNVFELREYRDGALAAGGAATILPVFNAVCTTCGFIHHFSAIDGAH